MGAMKLNDLLAPVNFAMGLYRVATGDREGAVESFQRSLTIEEGPDATRELANSYDALNRLELAEATYRRANHVRKSIFVQVKDSVAFFQKKPPLTRSVEFFLVGAPLCAHAHT